MFKGKMLMIDNGSTSDFLALDSADVSERFSEMEEIPTKGFNVLVRAKRLGQWWMLKGLKPEHREDLTYQELLSKEYDILTRVQHPNVIAVEGIENVDGYGRCIVMEWVDGETLAAWLKRPHSNQEKRKVLKQLLDAVEYVHRCQVVHRDLKPSNVMITRNGQHVKLIDFGLADTDNYAVFKQPAGTVGYISPEQMSSSTPDNRNDIYSLGSIISSMHMGGGWTYRRIVHRCQKKIEKRYTDVTSLRRDFYRVRRFHRFACILSLVCVLLLGVGFAYHEWGGPRQTYDVVTDFKMGFLRFQSWGGGFVTVQGIEDVDSCVEIPRTVTNEGVTYLVSEVTFRAFKNYKGLHRVVFPNEELHFMANAFKGCNHLHELYFRSKEPPIFGSKQWTATIEEVFEDYHFRQVTLYVPKGSTAAYRASAWGRFKNIKEF